MLWIVLGLLVLFAAVRLTVRIGKSIVYGLASVVIGVVVLYLIVVSIVN